MRQLLLYGTLMIGWETMPRTIDPRFASDADSQYLENLVHCSLISFDENGQVKPELAANYTWKSDKILQIKLRSGAKFSDDSLITTKDVIATYQFFQRKDLKTPSPRAGAFSNIEKIEALDAQTIAFHLKQPDAPFVSNLVVGILPEKIAQTNNMQTDVTATCGAFSLKSREINHITLKRNDLYNIEPPAKLSEVHIKIVRDETTRLSKLRKGELDLVQNGISRFELKNLSKRAPGLKIETKPGLNTAYLGFNVRDPILSKPEVRQAISRAINRNDIIKYGLEGLAAPAEGMLLSNDPFFLKSLNQIPFDQSAKLGPMQLTIKTTTNLTRLTVAKAIAAQLRKIGIDAKVESLEWGRFKADVEAGRVQMWTLNWVGFKDPDILRYAFASESFPPNGANRGYFKNDELDKILTEARATVDVDKRKTLYFKAQEIVERENPYAFLWHEDIYAVMKKNIKNFKIYADGSYRSLREVEIE